MKLQHAGDMLRRWFFILPFAGNWNYDNPNTWPQSYPECGGREQSPIALYSRYASPHHFIQLEFHNYKKPLFAPVEMHNNGYTAEIGVQINEDESIPFLTVGGYGDWYELQGVHFHWGSDGVQGSEHTINGERYDLEMHIVHKNSKYSTIEEAREYPDGFVVLGILFNAVPEENFVRSLDTENHRTLNEIFNSLELITEYNSTAEIEGPLTMKSFIPDLDISEFYTYKGSLTTPPCSESVLWFVFSDILPISYDDLKKFWNLLDADGDPLLNNFRPTQVGYRPVYRKRNKLHFI